MIEFDRQMREVWKLTRRKRMSRYDGTALEKRMSLLEKRLERLECPHKNVKFGGHYFDFGGGYSQAETCKDCGKLLRKFGTEKEFLEAKPEHQKAKCSDGMAETKARLKELGAMK